MTITYLENLKEKIKDKNISVVSFDFFDTLMSRRVPHPKDIFLILGSRLSNLGYFSFDIDPERFQSLRIAAEQRARDAGAFKEIGIRDIYEQFPPNFFTTDNEKIVEQEVLTEKEFLFASADMIEAVKLAHKRGKKVIVVSDIYLDAAHLRAFWGDQTPGIDIQYFASSEYRTGKYDKLFDIVLKALKCKPSSILHSGDNYISDCQTPASKGIKTCFLPHGSATFWNNFNSEVKYTNPHERMSLEHGDLGITALRCKVMLHRHQSEIDKEGYVRYGAQTLGPVLSPFIHWVKAVCIESQVDAVLPLMREGYMIDKLLGSYEQVNSVPTFLSRRVLFQASLTKADSARLESLRFNNLDSTVGDYLELIGLFRSDAPELKSIFDDSLSDNDSFKHLLSTVVHTPRLLAKVRARAVDMRKGIIAHVIKATSYKPGVTKKVALVDVGWNATIQRLLQEIIADEGLAIQFIGLYMMTTPAVNELIFDRVLAKGYYVDGGYPTNDFATLSRTLEIFEQSCAPPHGSVLRHDIRTGQPTLKPDLIPAYQRADIDDIQEGILLFNDLYRKNIPDSITSHTLKSLAEKIRPILRRAMLAPNRNEAELFINWVHDDNLAAANTMPIFGSELSRDFISHKTLKQFFNTPMSELYWPAGALAIHDPEKSKVVALAALNSLPVETFDTDLNAASELATSRAGDNEYSIKDHQHLYKNTAGKTYLKFSLDLEKNATLRWTPISRPFDLTIDFVVITYKNTNGLSTSLRVDGNRLLSDLASFVGMEQYDIASWRGKGEGCAFYINNLSRIGISSSCTITLEIACLLRPLEVHCPSHPVTSADFDYSNTSAIEMGRSFIEAFNGTAIAQGQNTLQVADGVVNLAGWMVHSEFKNTEGDFFMRLTNPLGKAQFIKMNSIKRPDVASHLRKEAAPHLLDDIGFSLSNYRIKPGQYTAVIVKKGNSSYVLGRETWQLNIEGTLQ